MMSADFLGQWFEHRSEFFYRTERRDAVQPRAEVRPRLEPSQLPIRPKEALLNHIFRILLVADHPERQPKHAPAVLFHQDAEGLAVALAGTSQDGCCFARVHLIHLDGV